MAVELRLSGGQGNTDPNGSLGGQRSDTIVTDDVLENLFDNINRAEALIGRTEFRCIYIYNTGGGHISGVTAEIKINPSLTEMSVGVDPAGRGDGRNDGIAVLIPQEDTSPSGVKFFGEENTDDGRFNIAFDKVILPLGLLKANEGTAIWLKRKTEVGTQQTVTVNIDIVHDAVSLPGDTVDDGGAVGELLLVNKTVSGTYKIGTMRVGFSDLG